MTIDEAIAKYKEITNIDAFCPGHCNISCDNCLQESRQLTEWLEDYKYIKQWKSDVMDDFCRYDASSFEELIVNARNKAIDDFASKLIMHFADWKLSNAPFNDETDGIGEIICETIENAIGGVEEIAEQLKSTCNKEKCTYTTRKPIEYFDYDTWLQSEAE